MSCVFFFQAEDGIRDLVRSRGLGDVYKRQALQSVEQLHLYAVAGLHPGAVFGQHDEAVGFRHRTQHARPLVADGFYLLFAVDRNNLPAQVFAAPGLLPCLLYTSDAADERSSVDLGGRRILKKKKTR